MHCKKKILNQSFPHNSRKKRDIAKISAVLKPMKSDYYVVKFWQKSEHFYFLGTERVKKYGWGQPCPLYTNIKKLKEQNTVH